MGGETSNASDNCGRIERGFGGPLPVAFLLG